MPINVHIADTPQVQVSFARLEFPIMESAPPIDHPTSANVVSTWLNTYHDPAEKTIQYIGEIRDPEIKHEVVNATTQYVEQSYSQIVINKMPPELKARFCEENGLVNGDGHECTVDAIRWLQSVQSWTNGA